MGKRINRPFHNEKTREKIRTTQILKRIQDHVLGKIELKNSQVKCGEILLRKTLPDLHQVQGAGEDGQIEHSHTGEVTVKHDIPFDAIRKQAEQNK